MQKSEGAVTPIPVEILSKLEVLAGDAKSLHNRPTATWDDARVAFLADLSHTLLAQPDVRALPDVVTFAYWARKANLHHLKKQTSREDRHQIGLGLVFHICPSNVPVNFAFSMAFGLLAGDTGVLRLPSAESPTVDAIVDALRMLLDRPEHAAMRGALLLVRYPRDDAINAFWSEQADGRIIWGGDATVRDIRRFSIPPRAREVAFPDRYSICAMRPDAVIALDEDGLTDICARLYNDIYLMDQAACSSPQLVTWIGDPAAARTAQDRLWPALAEHVRTKYQVKPILMMDKFVRACDNVLAHENINTVHQHGNVLYRVELSALAPAQDTQRGYAGTIHEIILPSLDQIAPIITERYQTLTYFGYYPQELAVFVEDNRLRGIDRVVPVGQAIDMNVIWDGYDIIASLSRVIDVQ